MYGFRSKTLDYGQVKDFRRDRKSIKSLRNYRLFWVDSYKGKEVSYIEDNLERKYELFVKACQKHGIDIIEVTVKNLINSKSLFSTSIFTLASIIAGEPKVAGLAAIAGATLEVGKIAMDIRTTKSNHEKLIRSSELSYLYCLHNTFRHHHNKVLQRTANAAAEFGR